MIKVDNLRTLDGLRDIKVDELVTFENGVLKHGDKDLSFDENSGVELVRLKGDTKFIINNYELLNDTVITKFQETNETPFVQILPRITLQPNQSNLIIRLWVKHADEFIELIPLSITSTEVIYEAIEVNTDTLSFKVNDNNGMQNVAQLQVDCWSY
jgi:hypothetical protein